MTDWRPVRGRLTVFGSYVVLTEPVPELLEQIGWTGGEAIVDARMFLHYFRTTNDGRVLMGSGSGPIGRGNRIDERFTHDSPTAGRAELGLRRLLPGLGAARVERSWGGPIDVSADHLPFVGSAGGGIHFAAGYSGNGVGPSWLAGQALASLAVGRDDEWSSLPTRPSPAERVCPASRSATSAARSSAPRSSPAKKPTKPDGGRRASRRRSRRCRACSASSSAPAEAVKPWSDQGGRSVTNDPRTPKRSPDEANPASPFRDASPGLR